MKTRFQYYREEIASLGSINWAAFKMQGLRLKRARRGTLFPFRSRLPHPVYCRAQTSDFAVFYQIVVEDEYRCLRDVKDVGLIIDCGANVGYSSAFFMALFPNAELIAVEPDDGNYMLLHKNLQPYQSRTTLIEAGVWSKSTALVVEKPENIPHGNEWAFTVREALPSETGEISSVDIPRLLEMSGRDRISILKIDIEGSEKEVFSANCDWLSKVDNLVIELHGDEAAAPFLDKIAQHPFEHSHCGELDVYKRVAQ